LGYYTDFGHIQYTALVESENTIQYYVEENFGVKNFGDADLRAKQYTVLFDTKQMF